MVICLFGESCAGKSTIAAALKERIGATVYTGKDYIKLARNEAEAKRIFAETLKAHEGEDGETIIYVVSEKEHLALLPEGAVRVFARAELGVIKERFAKRTGGVLPAPVAAMLEKKHGTFDGEKRDLTVDSGEESLEAICDKILSGRGI